MNKNMTIKRISYSIIVHIWTKEKPVGNVNKSVWLFCCCVLAFYKLQSGGISRSFIRVIAK